MELPVKYGQLSPAMRDKVREEYVRLQKNVCAYCGEPLTGEPRSDIKSKEINKGLFPSAMFMNPVHLHHDRSTGLTTGAVHCYCDAVIWQYDRSREWKK
jgi:hypothetical protein